MSVPVSITVGTDNPISVPWQPKMTAQNSLEAAYNQIQDSSQFSFALQYYGTYQGPPYGPLGYLVIMLNGTYDLPAQSQYWEIYYNGQPASKGIDDLILNPGDKLTFLNEAYVEAKHAGTTVGAKQRLHHGRGKESAGVSA
jgi:hypothetical protein